MAGWLLENGIVTAVLAALVWALCRWGRIGPVWRHALWMVVLIKLLMPPVFAWPWAVRDPLATAPIMADGSERSTMELLKSLLGDDVGPRPRSDTAAPAAMPHTGVGAGAAAPGASKPESAAPAAADATVAATVSVHSPYWTRLRTTALLMALWLAGAAAYTALQLLRIAGMIRRVRGSSSATPELLAALRQRATSMKVRIPRARVLRNLGSPYIWCLFRPTLLWPAEIEPTTDAARAMLVHELAHIRRRDHWVGWMMLLAGCAWWWNPVYWLTCRELRRNAEFACDGWAVQTLTAARRSYAEALLGVVEGRFKPRLPLAAGIRDGGRQIIEARLRMIMQEKVPLRLPRAGAVIVALAVLASIPAWAQQGGAATSRPKFTLSKETTAITSPLNADGTPDYVGALNAKYSQGVTPENNGFVVWLEAVGTRWQDGNIADAARDRVLAMCGAKATPPDGVIWKGYTQYLIDVKKLTDQWRLPDERWNAALNEMKHARFELWTREQHPDFAEYLTANNKWLDKMVEATSRPKWWSPAVNREEHPKMMSLPNQSLYPLSEAAYELASRATGRAGMGDFEGFSQDVLTIKRLGRYVAGSPMMVEGVVGMAINHLADDAIGTVAVSGKLTAEQGGALSRALATLPGRRDAADEIEFERWTTLDTFFLIIDGDPDFIRELQNMGVSKFKTKPDSMQPEEVDLDAALKVVNQTYDMCMAPGREPSLAQIRKRDNDLDTQIAKWSEELRDNPDLRKGADETRTAYSERVARGVITIMTRDLTGIDEKFKEEDMRDRMLNVLLAAAKVHAVSGKWPATLEDLVPEAIKELPADYFSEAGKAAVKYVAVGDGVRIYSVGRNGVDDGGKANSGKNWDDIAVGKQE